MKWGDEKRKKVKMVVLMTNTQKRNMSVKCRDFDGRRWISLALCKGRWMAVARWISAAETSCV